MDVGNHPLFPKLEDGSRDIDRSITHVRNLEAIYASATLTVHLVFRSTHGRTSRS